MESKLKENNLNKNQNPTYPVGPPRHAESPWFVDRKPHDAGELKN